MILTKQAKHQRIVQFLSKMILLLQTQQTHYILKAVSQVHFNNKAIQSDIFKSKGNLHK